MTFRVPYLAVLFYAPRFRHSNPIGQALGLWLGLVERALSEAELDLSFEALLGLRREAPMGWPTLSRTFFHRMCSQHVSWQRGDGVADRCVALFPLASVEWADNVSRYRTEVVCVLALARRRLSGLSHIRLHFPGTVSALTGEKKWKCVIFNRPNNRIHKPMFLAVSGMTVHELLACFSFYSPFTHTLSYLEGM